MLTKVAQKPKVAMNNNATIETVVKITTIKHKEIRNKIINLVVKADALKRMNRNKKRFSHLVNKLLDSLEGFLLGKLNDSLNQILSDLDKKGRGELLNSIHSDNFEYL